MAVPAGFAPAPAAFKAQNATLHQGTIVKGMGPAWGRQAGPLRNRHDQICTDIPRLMRPVLGLLSYMPIELLLLRHRRGRGRRNLDRGSWGRRRHRRRLQELIEFMERNIRLCRQSHNHGRQGMGPHLVIREVQLHLAFVVPLDPDAIESGLQGGPRGTAQFFAGIFQGESAIKAFLPVLFFLHQLDDDAGIDLGGELVAGPVGFLFLFLFGFRWGGRGIGVH